MYVAEFCQYLPRRADETNRLMTVLSSSTSFRRALLSTRATRYASEGGREGTNVSE